MMGTRIYSNLGLSTSPWRKARRVSFGVFSASSLREPAERSGRLGSRRSGSTPS